MNDHVFDIVLTCFNVVTDAETRTSESVRKHGNIPSSIFLVTLQTTWVSEHFQSTNTVLLYLPEMQLF